jgi:hypothetical protein
MENVVNFCLKLTISHRDKLRLFPAGVFENFVIGNCLEIKN